MDRSVLILGGGLAGLSAAYTLEKAGVRYLLIEKEDEPGGLARTIHYRGFFFDYTGHFLHLRDSRIRQWIFSITGGSDQWMETERKSAIFMSDYTVPYPFQMNLAYLPPEIRKECVIGAVNAYLKNKQRNPDTPVRNFKEWVLLTQGEGIYKWFMKPYNEKLYRVPLESLTTAWLGPYVPQVDLERIIEGALEKREKSSFGYNARFLYPKHGGISILPESIYAQLNPEFVHLGEEVVRIDLENAVVETNRSTYKYSYVINTLPLNHLLHLVGAPLLNLFSGKLRSVGVLAIFLGWESKHPYDYHWLYIPDEDIPFYRVGFPSGVSPATVPEGMQSAYFEVSFSDDVEHPENRIEALYQSAVSFLKRIGVLRTTKDVHVKLHRRIAPAYVIYDEDRECILPALQEFLSKHRVVLAGRYGKWYYASMEDAIKDGIHAAQWVIESRS